MVKCCHFSSCNEFGSKNNATIKAGQDILKGVCYYDGHSTFAKTSASRQPKKYQKTNLNIFVSGLKTSENYENGLIYMFEQDYDDQKVKNK